jgi:hypothetical protein
LLLELLLIAEIWVLMLCLLLLGLSYIKVSHILEVSYHLSISFVADPDDSYVAVVT